MSYLFITLGGPGSGKSFVAAWLCEEVSAVHLRADDMRLAMCGEDRLELHRKRSFINPLYGAMDYATKQTLAAGGNVIYDANVNRRSKRAALVAMADAAGVTTIVIYVKTPIETAEQRVLNRAEQGGQPIFDDIGFVRRITGHIEQPDENEHCIVIDGLADEASQRAAFQKQFATIKA